MKRLLALLTALVVVASSCGSDGDSTSALEALGFTTDEAACYEDAYEVAGLDISEVLQSDDLSEDDAATRDRIATECSGVTSGGSGNDGDSDGSDSDSSGSGRSVDDLSAIERGMVQGMMQDGASEEGALCVVNAIQDQDIDLGQLLRAGENVDEVMTPEMMTVVFSCMDELFDSNSFAFGDFRDDANSDGSTYGDNPELDALWDACGGGDGAACDELYWISPIGSDYEDYGNTCGDRVKDGAFSCEEAIGGNIEVPSGDALYYGDDAHLDGLWDACAQGNGQACDDLYWESPIGSEYEDFGNTCGYFFTEGPPACADVNLSGPFDYGDDPALDILWDGCANWDFAACDELWLVSPIDSIYEEFGATCGWYFEDGLHDCATELSDLTDAAASTYGDDAELDLLWDACAVGDLVACDDLYWTSPLNSGYEDFASFCGGLATEEQWGSCADNLGT